MSTAVQIPESSSSSKSKKRKHDSENAEDDGLKKKKKHSKHDHSAEGEEDRERVNGEGSGRAEKWKDKKEKDEKEKKHKAKDKDKKEKKKHRDEDVEDSEKRKKKKKRDHDERTEKNDGVSRVNGELADADDGDRSERRKKKKKEKKDKRKGTEDGSLNSIAEEQDELVHDVPNPAAALSQDDDDDDEAEINGFDPEPGTAPASPKNPDPNTGDGILGNFLDSPDPSCFYSTRISLRLHIPAISLTTALNSVMAMHLTPLLLTYFPPVNGVVLAFTDPVLSTTPYTQIAIPSQSATSLHQDSEAREILAIAADDFGVVWVWLTVTFLVFRPQKGDILRVWSNVASHGFVGCLSYNIFQISIGKERIPEGWRWDGPAREARNKRKKGRLRDEDAGEEGVNSTTRESEQEAERPNEAYISDGAGFFVDASGKRVDDTFYVKVVDVDMVPERDRWTLHVDATLLDEEAEAKVREKEKELFEKNSQPGEDAEMSGGVVVGDSQSTGFADDAED